MQSASIQNYWDTRAKEHPERATTDDVYLREIEFRVVKKALCEIVPKTVLDVGCGDALTTSRLAREFPDLHFEGVDFSRAMIERAAFNVGTLSNIHVRVGDVLAPLDQQSWFAFSNRCLINLPSWDDQKSALQHIAATLPSGGHYLMIENFIEGHDAVNAVRVNFGLPIIPVRPHNLFFRRDQLLDFVGPLFSVRSDENISSSYYLATRVVYSRMCADAGQSPDYLNAHHKHAAELPFAGEFGPVRCLLLQKR